MEEVGLGSRTLQLHRQLLADGAHVPIGKRALDVLSVLAKAKGEVVTKDELLAAVWPGIVVEENALQVHVVALRRALGPEAHRLRTIRGVGYQLGLSAEAEVPKQRAPAEAPAAGIKAIVVLPFVNMSGDREQDYFAKGITEDIVTDLSKISALLVISGAGGERDAMEAARRFGASHVLEGSVRKAGDRVRITAQLIDGCTAAHIWAERYDREMSDIFELQDELSQQIVDALKLRLLPEEKEAIRSRITRNPDAYDFYLRARGLRATMDLDCIRRSVEAYRRALALDPDFAKAWAGLATALMQNRSHFPAESRVTSEEIEDALERATRLEPDLPDVIASRAQYCIARRDWAGVDECIARFREIEGSDWSIFGHLLLIRGQPQEAAEHQYKVRKSDPLSAGASWALQFHLDCAGRFEEAEAEYQTSATMPAGQAPFEWEAIKRGIALGERVKVREKLLAHLREATFRLPVDGEELAEMLDDRSKAVAFLAAAVADDLIQDPLVMLSVAHLAVYLDAEDLALKALRVALIDVGGLLPVMDIWHPIFSGLRRRPEFKSLLIEVGLIDHCRKTGEWGEFIEPVSDFDFELKL